MTVRKVITALINAENINLVAGNTTVSFNAKNPAEMKVWGDYEVETIGAYPAEGDLNANYELCLAYDLRKAVDA